MRKSVIRMAALIFAAVIAFPSLAAAWGGVTCLMPFANAMSCSGLKICRVIS